MFEITRGLEANNLIIWAILQKAAYCDLSVQGAKGG